MNGNGHGNGNGHNGNGNGGGRGLPRFSGWWSSLMKNARGSDLELSAYRRLALQLHYDLPRTMEQRTTLLVTPRPSPFLASASAYLARSLAEELRQPVLLVDACSKYPVSSLLGCNAQRGFFEFLSNPGIPLKDLIVSTNTENVSFLPAGVPVAGSPDTISPLLQSASEGSDFVVLAGGSVLNDSISLALAPHVGCVLLLVIENETRTDDLDAARTALSYCKAKKLAVLLTKPIRGRELPPPVATH